jgi:hypothetical protein
MVFGKQLAKAVFARTVGAADSNNFNVICH